MISEGEKKVYLALYMSKEGLHIREICRLSGLAIPSVIKHVNTGQKEKMIVCEKKGTLKICRINFRNPKIVPIMQSVETERFNKLPHNVRDSFNSFISDLSERPLISLILGSFAKGNYSKGSDLDVLLVFQRIDNNLAKSIELSASKIRGRTMVNIQPVSLGYAEFEREIMNKENEFMKDMREHAIVLQGIETYLNVIGRFYG
jgi:predicted nucleotidyltransferase